MARQSGDHMGTPAEPGNERLTGADGSAGELAEPGSGTGRRYGLPEVR